MHFDAAEPCGNRKRQHHSNKTILRQLLWAQHTYPVMVAALQGCGLVCFSSAAAAAAAKADLHDKYKWAPDHAPMVLERVNAKKKRSNISHEGELHSLSYNMAISKTNR